MDASYQERLGERLRAIRQQQGLTLQQVEEASAGVWKAVVVGSYERGDRAISIAKLARLADFYRVPLRELLPTSEVASPTTPPTRGPRFVLDLTRLELEPGVDGAATPLSRYARTIQAQRGDHEARVLTLRGEDLRSLSRILDVAADELVSGLQRRGLLRVG